MLRVNINVDGVVFSNLGCAGLGALIHDDEGLVLVSLSEKVQANPEPEPAEALALQ